MPWDKQANLVWPMSQPVLVCLHYGNKSRLQIQRCLCHSWQTFRTFCIELWIFLENALHYRAVRTLPHQLYNLKIYLFNVLLLSYR